MGSVYRLTLRQLSGKWRLSIMTVLSAMPVVIAILMLSSEHAPSVREFESSCSRGTSSSRIRSLKD